MIASKAFDGHQVTRYLLTPPRTRCFAMPSHFPTHHSCPRVSLVIVLPSSGGTSSSRLWWECIICPEMVVIRSPHLGTEHRPSLSSCSIHAGLLAGRVTLRRIPKTVTQRPHRSLAHLPISSSPHLLIHTCSILPPCNSASSPLEAESMMTHEVGARPARRIVLSCLFYLFCSCG